MDKWELQRRTKKYALRVMSMADALPASVSGQVIAKQVVRSSTSVGANYRAACRARSGREFTHKLGIAEEEADETLYWMELAVEGGLVKPKRMEALAKEGDELLRILIASRKSALASTARNRKSEIQNRKLTNA